MKFRIFDKWYTNIKIIEKYRVYLKSSVLYLGSSVLSAAISIAINPLMAKNLSPEDYAIIGYFTSFQLLLLPLLNFNLITYYLRNYYKIPDERRTIVADTILISSLIYGVLSLFVSLFLFYIYFQISKISFDFYPFALIAFLPVLLNNFINFYLVNCRLKREAIKYAKLNITNSIILATISIVLVVYYKQGAIGKLNSVLIVSLFYSIYCFVKSLNKWQFDFSVLKDAIKFSYPLTLSALLWYFFTGYDRALLVGLNDNNTLGIYNVGLQIASILTVFYTAISQTFEPDIYKAIAENNNTKLVKLFSAIIGINAIPNILFIIFAPLIIGLLTANRYLESTTYSQIFALRNITMSFYYMAIMVVVGYGYTKQEFIIRLSATIPIIIFMKLLVSNYTFYGAAWSQVIAFLVLAILLYLFIHFRIIKAKTINNA